ncbi:hypothetical protein CP97_14756 [Aurantiacibacter atlanticus]|uniref:Uncharacterized protein n=1 Tax=Aurantiacibacter atlanticus TaxID=1648404 RepID=A0A161IA08_9SPHN|nr:hypothetical protein CP97_14756 [Aurantiacibacter atlanticus]
MWLLRLYQRICKHCAFAFRQIRFALPLAITPWGSLATGR